MNSFLKNTIFIVIGMVFFISCSDDFKKIAPKEYNGKFPDESATDIEIVFSDSGRTSFILYAPLLNKYLIDKPYMDCPKGITITSFDNEGNKQSVLTADYAISEDKSERMEASSNVVIRDLIKHETIETEIIIWDKKHKRIYSESEVRQIKADGTINIGDGFDADERFTKHTIQNPRGEMLTDDL